MKREDVCYMYVSVCTNLMWSSLASIYPLLKSSLSLSLPLWLWKTCCENISLPGFLYDCFCSYAQGRDYDPDRERAETKKLKRQLKREAKGAARELRKDNYFLAEEKAQETAVLEQERDEKYRKAMSFLEQQESAFKSGQLGKGRKRKKR